MSTENQSQTDKPLYSDTLLQASVTDSESDADATNKTDETDFVSNQEFLNVIFGQENSIILPLIVSFMGNPQKVVKSSWAANPRQSGDILSSSANNYFTIAAFRPDESGRYRRCKGQFAGLYAVMLDDIGTKIPLERLKLRRRHFLKMMKSAGKPYWQSLCVRHQ